MTQPKPLPGSSSEIPLSPVKPKRSKRKERRRRSVLQALRPAQTPRVHPLSPHARQRLRSRRHDPGSLPSSLPQDRQLPRRVRLLHLAPSPHRQSRPHASPQERVCSWSRSRRPSTPPRKTHPSATSAPAILSSQAQSTASPSSAPSAPLPARLPHGLRPPRRRRL